MTVVDEIANATLARRQLMQFALRVSPGFQDARHSRFITGEFENVERGYTPRLCLTAPPGFGKSTAAQLFTAWALGRDPSRKVLMLSASERLAHRNSAVIRDHVSSDRWPFPDVKLSMQSASVGQWMTNAGGGLLAIGQGGTVTGFRANIVVCDDLQADTMSQLTRDNLEEWFRSVLSTRLEPDGVICMIQTRWSTDDLIARIEYGDSGDQWKFVNLPAIAKYEDPHLGRAEGESLWPERWTVEKLDAVKAEVGSHTFSSQYMGEPTPEGGRIFDPSWFTERYKELPDARPQTYVQQLPRWAGLPFERESDGSDEFALTVTALDAAMKENIGGSYSALCSIRIINHKCYVLEVERERAGMQRLLQMIQAHCERNDTSTLIVEDAAMGSAVVDVLRGNAPYNVLAVKPVDSKEVRAMGIVPTCESGGVILPERAPWLGYFEQELRDFPGSSSSDATDSFVWAVTYAWELYTREIRARNRVESLRGWINR